MELRNRKSAETVDWIHNNCEVMHAHCVIFSCCDDASIHKKSEIAALHKEWNVGEQE